MLVGGFMNIKSIDSRMNQKQSFGVLEPLSSDVRTYLNRVFKQDIAVRKKFDKLFHETQSSQAQDEKFNIKFILSDLGLKRKELGIQINKINSKNFEKNHPIIKLIRDELGLQIKEKHYNIRHFALKDVPRKNVPFVLLRNIEANKTLFNHMI